MKTTIKKGIGVLAIMIFAVILTLSMASFSFAADDIEEANAPAVSQYHYDPIAEGDSVFENYCCFTHDAKFNTIDRDKYVKKGTLEKAVIKDTKTTFAKFGDHTAVKNITVTGVSGLSKVKKAQLTGSYKVIPIKLELKDDNGNKSSVKSTVILVYAKAVSSNNNNNNNNNSSNNNSSITDNGSTTGSAVSSAKNAKKNTTDNTKKSTGKIEKKNDSDNNQTLVGGTDENGGGQGGSGSDPLAIGLFAAAGLAALIFAISIIPDIGVIRWFNQKKALRTKL
ncbi:MAG: hypothetical protein VB031_04095 [Eubacteriaceae bacterium]|nr:hypothetical protein [Eubacteriaceae bacterium]